MPVRADRSVMTVPRHESPDDLEQVLTDNVRGVTLGFGCVHAGGEAHQFPATDSRIDGGGGLVTSEDKRLTTPTLLRPEVFRI